MIIRNGNYTKIENYDFALFVLRHESPTPFTHFIIKWYLDDICPIESFELNQHGDFIKILKRDEVKNSYSVKTIGKYKGDKFRLLGYNKDRNVIGLMTQSSKLAKKYHFLKLSDRYIKEVNALELDMIWEERTKSTFDLPLPKGLEKTKVVYKNEVS